MKKSNIVLAQNGIDYRALKQWFFKRHFCMYTTSYEYHLEKCIKTFERFAKELYRPSWQPILLEKHQIPTTVPQVRLGKTLPTSKDVGFNILITEDRWADLKRYVKEQLDKRIIDEYQAREEEYFAMKDYEEGFEI